MTEHDIETEVDERVAALNRRFLNSEMTPSYYEVERRAIARWAEQTRRDGTTTTQEG